MIDLHLAACAAALDKYRSFARAAVAMHVTQPTFSRKIAALEDDLGIRLFDRTSKQVVPTAEGELFLTRARALLAEAARLREELGDFGKLRIGELVIGAGPYPLEISVIEAVGRLAATSPGVRVEIIEGQWRELVPRLLSGEVGLVIAEMAMMSAEPRLEVEPLPAHRGTFCCRPGHPLAGRRDLTMRQVLEFPLVGIRMPARIARFLPADAGLTPDLLTGDMLPRITTTSTYAAREIVKRSNGVGLCIAGDITGEIAAGELVVLELDAALLQTQYGIASLRDRSPSPAESAFVHLLRQVERERMDAQ
jgi:DNA-binding transcriptional LysR family regulator